MKTEIIARNLRNIIVGHSKETMQATFIGCVFDALIHGNINYSIMKELRNSDANKKFTSKLLANLPMKWNKDTECYEKDTSKKVKLLEKYSFNSALQVKDSPILKLTTIEDVKNALPELFEKVVAKTTEDKTEEEVNKGFKATNFTAKKAKIAKLTKANISDELKAVREYMTALEAKFVTAVVIDKLGKEVIVESTEKAA
jgi:hypothetical protein